MRPGQFEVLENALKLLKRNPPIVHSLSCCAECFPAVEGYGNHEKDCEYIKCIVELQALIDEEKTLKQREQEDVERNARLIEIFKNDPKVKI